MPITERHPKFVSFPNPILAEPDGLLAIGGDLSVSRLLAAYRQGIFPWCRQWGQLLWFSPDPRMVLFPSELRVSKSMKTLLHRGHFRVTFDTQFEAVMRACQTTTRTDQNGSWIDDEFITAYTQLHKLGWAHAVEVWQEDTLVGGLYGIAMGRCFFGESMFSTVSNASKFGFITLVQWLQAQGYILIDCQAETPHLASLGAKNIPRDEFLAILVQNQCANTHTERWVL